MTTPRPPVDWDQVKDRLARTEEALFRSQRSTPQARLAAHEARTRALSAQPGPRGDDVEVVEFVLGGRHYAVPTAHVVEVRALNTLTPLPCVPRFVSGIMSVQGRIIAVIDLKTFLDVPESGLTDLNKVIILRHEDMEFGVLADVIVGGRWLPPSEMGTLTLLDLSRMTADPRFTVDAEVAV